MRDWGKKKAGKFAIWAMVGALTLSIVGVTATLVIVNSLNHIIQEVADEKY